VQQRGAVVEQVERGTGIGAGQVVGRLQQGRQQGIEGRAAHGQRQHILQMIGLSGAAA
jgi:hypothetical protein